MCCFYMDVGGNYKNLIMVFRKIISNVLTSCGLILILLIGNGCNIGKEKIEIHKDEAGLIFQKFDGGILRDSILLEGIHYYEAWNDIIVVNIANQRNDYDFSYDIGEDNIIKFKYILNYKPILKNLPSLFISYQHDYQERFITPTNEDILENYVKQDSVNEKSYYLEIELEKLIQESYLKEYFELSIDSIEIEIIDKEK